MQGDALQEAAGSSKKTPSTGYCRVATLLANPGWNYKVGPALLRGPTFF